jgi:thiamine-phosphate pyrophosphorylase
MTLADQLRLMVLTDPVLLKGRDTVDVCLRATAGGGGATVVQVRWKDGTPRELLQLAEALVRALPVPVLVNDRVDVALAAGAAGAHLGQDDAPLDALRPQLPPGFLLGISVGSALEAERVGAWPADYWSIGPCFATTNKADAGAALGAAGFAALARLAPEGVPVIGIGGITPANAAAIARSGAVGVAVMGAVLGAADPEGAARALSAAVAPA